VLFAHTAQALATRPVSATITNAPDRTPALKYILYAITVVEPVVGVITTGVRKMKLSLFLNKKYVIASVARQSRSQCMSALYSYGIATSPQVLLPMPLLV
jgi:hypothetical protein